MKFRNWFLSFAVLAGLAATAAEAVPEPEKTPAAEAGASAPALELPPRIGLFMKSSDPDDGTHGTVGVSLTGVPAGQYFGGLQLGFFGENFEFHNSYGIWAGWYGEMQRQKGLQFAFTNVAWKYATGQFALGGNFAELCEGVQAAVYVPSAKAEDKAAALYECYTNGLSVAERTTGVIAVSKDAGAVYQPKNYLD